MSQPPENESAQVLREVRALGRDLNEMKVQLARVETAQSAMAHQVARHDQQAERAAAMLAEFDRFRAGAGVKFGGAQWGVALLIMTLVSVLVSVLTRPDNSRRDDRSEDRRGP